jgi:acetyl esterase/lipase
MLLVCSAMNCALLIAFSLPLCVNLQIHGGGWVLQSEAYQDNMLQHYADHSSLIVISVGYRLAPEDPYPAGNEDCVDVAEHLIRHGKEEFGSALLFMGGDSAGAHLSVLTCFRLLKSCPEFAFRGLVLNFGAYDISGCLPQVHHFTLPLLLDGNIMHKYISPPFFSSIDVAVHRMLTKSGIIH